MNPLPSQLKTILFYTILFAVFTPTLVLMMILDHRWLSYIIVGILIIIILISRKQLATKQYIIVWVIVLLVTGLSLVYGRPNLAVSFQGHYINETVKLINFTQQKWLDERRKFKSQPYDINDWTPPENYQNELIQLTETNGYLLSNTNQESNHVIYQIHGGAYIKQFTKRYNEIAIKYSKAYDNADVFSIDYRTAPEYEHPAALKDAIEGYQWLLAQGYQHDDIIIAGDSSGGGLALAMTLKLRDTNQPLPKSLVLASPWSDLSAEGESYKTKIKDDAIFGSPSIEDAPQYPIPITYAGEHDLTDPYLSPAYGDYEGFPPILIQTGSEELLLSDSEIIEQKAKEAELKIFPGMFHNFYINHPSIPEGKEAWEHISEFIEKR
ncbi:alpha/beta hydrolase [Aquisalibacillus elongatus]|uniref:Acetyl esterase/lipase n=1 Tax=Aquisalibacillus elongatus TaxID=485577 RepID=A0A3N5BSS2_9BACI|nr:alpha/beta hydrolase [Aquisalibacillus elongatus]RPF50542.1 acetyl esterase/lipase [Aquisalibacillus elongatus]